MINNKINWIDLFSKVNYQILEALQRVSTAHRRTLQPLALAYRKRNCHRHDRTAEMEFSGILAGD